MEETPAAEITNVESGQPVPGTEGGQAPPPPAPPAVPQTQVAPPVVEGAAQAQIIPGQAQVAPPSTSQPIATAAAPQPPASAAAPPPPPPPAPETLPPAPPASEAIAPAQPKVMDAEWPHPGYTGPQPWEAENPPALTQNHVMLSSGSAGPEVVELAAYLAHLGYSTSISSGQNPHAIYDSGVSDAVRQFCADYGAEEDPAVRRARTEDTVGPWLWEAIVRAAHKKIASQGD